MYIHNLTIHFIKGAEFGLSKKVDKGSESIYDYNKWKKGEQS